MAASKSTRTKDGATRFSKPSKSTTIPSSLVLVDTADNDWYMWFDTSGTLRFADAATVEAAGFNFNTGGVAAASFVVPIGLLAASVDTDMYVADRPLLLLSITESHSVVGGAAAAVRPRKITDTSAPGAAASATVIELSAAISLVTTVNTPQTPALTAAPATSFATGNRLALDFSGTLTGLVGTLWARFAPIG